MTETTGKDTDTPGSGDQPDEDLGVEVITNPSNDEEQAAPAGSKPGEGEQGSSKSVHQG